LIYAARSVAANRRQSKAAGQKRLVLVGFAALLVLLFAGIAIADGIGDPTIPSEAVAIVEDAPGDIGTITEAELRHAVVQAAAESQVSPVPKPGDEQYDGLRETALGELLDSIWIQGQAAEMGYSPVTPQEVAAELKKIKEQSFQSEKQYQEFLEESHYTDEDVDRRVTLQILSTKIQGQIQEDAPTPSSSEIENYYEAAKASQFTTPESRDIRIVVNKDKSKVEEAKAALEKDDSVQNWEKVAKKYSTDPATKNKGGLQTNLSEGGVAEPLGGEVFATDQGEFGGPLQETRGFVIFEVAKITPEKVQSLEEAEPQIKSQLAEQLAQQDFTAFVNNYNSTWASRTFCTAEVVMPRCDNYKGDGRSAEASPACFEADPKEPAEACPALVTPIKPAQPGSVTVLEPKGQQLAQRPRPAGTEAAAAPESTELPAGAVPEGAPEAAPEEAAPEGE
jgi:parvulin-like peptidyl-prolyl isomerase